MKAWIRHMAVILLSAFILIAAGEIAHHHDRDDVHCYSAHEQHIHIEIHHCSFCEFTFSTAGSVNLISYHFYTHAFYFAQEAYPVLTCEMNRACTALLRAPPATV